MRRILTSSNEGYINDKKKMPTTGPFPQVINHHLTNSRF